MYLETGDEGVFCVAAICKTCHSCFATGISIAAGASVIIENCSASPCPNCGGEGALIDGLYEPPAIRLSKVSDIEKVIKSLGVVAQAIRNNEDTAPIIQDAESRLGGLGAYLQKFIPTDQKSLGECLANIQKVGLILAGLTAVSSRNEILEAVSAKLSPQANTQIHQPTKEEFLRVLREEISRSIDESNKSDTLPLLLPLAPPAEDGTSSSEQEPPTQQD